MRICATFSLACAMTLCSLVPALAQDKPNMEFESAGLTFQLFGQGLDVSTETPVVKIGTKKQASFVLKVKAKEPRQTVFLVLENGQLKNGKANNMTMRDSGFYEYHLTINELTPRHEVVVVVLPKEAKSRNAKQRIGR